MLYKHNQYLEYEVPNNWCAEYNDNNLLIYNPEGEGATTVSFFNALNSSSSLDEQISVLAKRFIDQNSIDMHSPLILANKRGNTILYGTGSTHDGWFIKIWIVAKYPKIVFATYQSDHKSKELDILDSIIDTFHFVF